MIAHRSLIDIAEDIRVGWPKVHRAALPYLVRMRDIGPEYMHHHPRESRWVIRMFLDNSTTWRGEDAKRVRAELKAMLR